MAAEFAAFLHDADSRRVVREMNPQATIRRGSVRNAARACQTEESADVLLVDLDGEHNPMVDMATLLQVCRPETTILATGSENNVTLANDLYRGGVFLYLPKPLDVSDLRRGMREVEAAHDEMPRPEIQTSRLVLVLGKGMGTNTVTALLARLAAARGRYVICLDLDADFGTLSLALDTPPERGLAQALQSADAGLAVDRLQARVSDRIGLIAHPFDQAGQRPNEDHLIDLIGNLSSHAHMVVACGMTPAHVEALRHLTTNHVVVFEPTPAGVSIAARWLRILDGAASTLIVNHARPLPTLLGQEQLRTSLGDRGPDLELPYIKNMARAMALGEPEQAFSKRERDAFDRILNPLVGLAAGDQAE